MWWGGLPEVVAGFLKSLLVCLMMFNRLSWSAAGTVHVPTDQLPAALNMAPREWEAAYRCAKPGPEEWLVMQCRTNRRAAWAAQVAQDAGWPRVLVYRQVGVTLLSIEPC